MSVTQHSQDLLFIDDDVRQQLVEMIGAATFTKLAEQFLAELAEAHPVLVQLLENGQGEEAASLAHKVAGSAAVLGSEGVRQFLVTIEHQARDGALGHCSELVETLPVLLPRIKEAMLSGVTVGGRAPYSPDIRSWKKVQISSRSRP